MDLPVEAIYVRMLAAEEEAKGSFNDGLQDAIDSAASGDMLIVAGDWNARPSPADVATRHILGNVMLRTRYANGVCLVNFAWANRLAVSSTRFKHPQHHLVTWFTSNGRTRNQSDHMLVRPRWAPNVIDFWA